MGFKNVAFESGKTNLKQTSNTLFMHRRLRSIGARKRNLDRAYKQKKRDLERFKQRAEKPTRAQLLALIQQLPQKSAELKKFYTRFPKLEEEVRMRSSKAETELKKIIKNKESLFKPDEVLTARRLWKQNYNQAARRKNWKYSRS